MNKELLKIIDKNTTQVLKCAKYLNGPLAKDYVEVENKCKKRCLTSMVINGNAH